MHRTEGGKLEKGVSRKNSICLGRKAFATKREEQAKRRRGGLCWVGHEREEGSSRPARFGKKGLKHKRRIGAVSEREKKSKGEEKGEKKEIVSRRRLDRGGETLKGEKKGPDWMGQTTNSWSVGSYEEGGKGKSAKLPIENKEKKVLIKKKRSLPLRMIRE